MTDSVTATKKFRFYERNFPAIGEIVVVKIRRIGDSGAYVSLSAYGDIEGMILTTEYSRRRIRSMANYMKIGSQECAKVLRVDEEKGYIDLSKRQVDAEEKAEAEKQYWFAHRIHQILSGLQRKHTELSMPDLYQDFIWGLYRRYGHAYVAFQMIARNQPDILDNPDYKLSPEVKTTLLKLIQAQFIQKAEKIQIDIECTCFSEHGIDGIKAALKSAEAQSTQEILIKANVVAPPVYVLTTLTINIDEGIRLLDQAGQVAKATLNKWGGEVAVKQPARVMTQNDVEKQKQLLEKLSESNREIDGDED